MTTGPRRPSSSPPSGRDDVDRLADAFLARRRGGEDLTVEAFAAEHPALAAEILELFPTLLAMEAAGSRAALEQVGPYRIVRELGRGGMGVVYLAEDTRLSRRVALKVLTPSLGASTQILLRFRREAEIASRLDHPSICTVYEAGESDGVAWIAMRHVEGESLAQWIEARRAARTPVSKEDVGSVLRWTEEVARALHVAHEAGLIHRDVKPGNVMIDPDGRAVVLDFGLARPSAADDATLTRSGAMLGTPAYMSPEQILAARYRLDRRTDVYSLAVTLYEALTLRLPFEAATHGQLYQEILGSAPESPRRLNPSVGDDLRVVVATAMERDRERRYASAAEFADDLRRVRERRPIRARPAGAWLRLRRWAERNPVLATSTAGIFVTLAVGLGVALHLLAEVRGERDAKADALTDRESALRRTRALALASASAVAEELDTTLSLLLAREAVRTSETPETVSQLQTALSLPAEVWTFAGHEREVTVLAPSPDGSRVATGGWRGCVHLLDAATGASLRRLDAHAAEILDAAWSPDSRTFVTCDVGGLACIWTADGTEIARFRMTPEHVQRSVIPSRVVRHQMHVVYVDAERVAAVSPPRAGISAVADGRRLAEFDEVQCIALDPLTASLACLHADGVVRLHAGGDAPPEVLLEGVPVGRDPEHPDDDVRALRLAFSGGGERLAVSTTYWTRIWDREGTLLRTLPGDSNHYGVALFLDQHHFAMVPDRERILVAADSAKDDAAFAFDEQDVGGVDYAPSSGMLASGHFGPVRVHSDAGDLLTSFPAASSPVGPVRFLPDGRRLLTTGFDFFGTRDPRVRLWDVDPRGIAAFRGRWATTGDRATPGTLAVVGPDGCSVIDAVGDEVLRVSWSVGDISEARQVSCLALDASGRWLLLGSEFGGVTVVDRAGDVALHTKAHESQVRAAAVWSEDGLLSHVASCGDEKLLQVVDAKGAPVFSRPVSGTPKSLRYRDDGTLVVRWDDRAAAYGPGGEERPAPPEPPFRADGVRASLEDDTRVVLRDAAGNLVAARSTGMIWADEDAFAAEDGRIAVGGYEGMVRVWDSELNELLAFRAARSEVRSVALADGGRRLVVESREGVRIWSLDPAELLATADRRLARDFTPEERARYADLLGDPEAPR